MLAFRLRTDDTTQNTNDDDQATNFAREVGSLGFGFRGSVLFGQSGLVDEALVCECCRQTIERAYLRAMEPIIVWLPVATTRPTPEPSTTEAPQKVMFLDSR